MSSAAQPPIDVALPVAADCRAFDGHFPGAPVLPGAYLVALVVRALEQHGALAHRLGAAAELQQVKFLSPVRPGDSLRVILQPETDGIGFSVQRGDTVVARGRFRADEALGA